MPPPPISAPGFYGKLPAAGDFVTRRLPADFVRFWDRWTARHLAYRLETKPLYFLLGPMLGVTLPSRDRAGRPFPLTLATQIPNPTLALPPAAAAYLAALTTTALEATQGTLDPDTLDTRLLALPPPPAAPPGAPAPRLLLWTEGTQPHPADPDAPGAVLAQLLNSARFSSPS